MEELKRLVVTILIMGAILIGASGCPENKISVWTGGDNDALTVRGGYEIQDNIEVGVASTWWVSDDPPQTFGTYAIYEFDQILDVNSPIDAGFLPETFTGKPYLGGQIGLNVDGDGTYSSIMAGVLFNEIFFVEYQYRAYDEEIEQFLKDDNKIMFGVRIKF